MTTPSEREAFEAWASEVGIEPGFEKTAAWEAFQAGRASLAPPPVDATEATANTAPQASDCVRDCINHDKGALVGMKYARNLFSLCQTGEQVDQQLAKLSERIQATERDLSEARASPPSATVQNTPGIPFDDPRVQIVYALLCDNAEPPKGEHWEGFAARRIVAALSKEK